ncbi:MAG: cytochrome c [Nitrospirota bacterium]|nr:cytochrome c [Nitrospirota bacterium]
MNPGKRGFAVFGIAAGVILIGGTSAMAAGNQAEGKKIFDGICSSCHGMDGVTEIPGIPVFSNGERMDKDDAPLLESIKNGVDNPGNPGGMSMPPYGGGPELSDGQLADVLGYVRTLKK